MKMKNVKQAGFSLVELMVVVGIIGILAAIAVPKLQTFTAKAKQSEAKTNLKSVDTYQQAYFAENSSFGTAATIGAANLKWKTYAASGFPTADTGVQTYTVTATSSNKLCPAASSVQDVWTVNQDSVLSNTANGLTGC